ncbi:MAG: hypothetical protein A3J07_00490 [Candidatus Doudnabacteria bacterium RIFCSPLOWO2_02_FULL_49_13]|uniref:Uncharacterized protein n=1 Tax=Candidatus Doudnabacteria bacterium RIFCSPHIGHO2_12_FULL_48_16 TaxID=1817838 RepID=A0A1F5PIT2_9BACT|nr:MAG: hypothetical protein A3E29_00410 [Candidatus Doudnabacteria bacterium RIFCSPHIGHO2_12_FULL_48_16]OGF02840.1 MAG: hypothetical protein A3J07_00490 [Candidatus Doudnabacteria bacterium RIFCSPLOWO2_02_FULL_49_13]
MQHNQFIDNLILILESGENVGGIKLAQIVKRLTEMEVDEGGPYSLEPKQGATDIGLNLAVACFLALQDIHLPKLDAFLEKHLSNITEPFDSVIDDKTVRSLIDKYQTLIGSIDNEDLVKQPIAYDENEQRIMDLIQKKINARFETFSPALKEQAKEVIAKTILGNRDKQMPLMAYYTKVSLGRSGEAIPDELVADIGVANIFFWTAFIIYDDFWDRDEAADPRLLPIANILARHYTDFFIVLSDDKEFRPFFHDLMDKLDGSNAWEIENCRAKIDGNIFYIPTTLPDFGDYENKYRPASGHILSSVAILTQFGKELKTEDWGNIVSYFKHYLIAMQLNDDAHDWEEDLRRGHLSTVVTLLLSDLKKSGWKKETIDLSTDLPEIKKIFWFVTMPQYIKIALSETATSRKALRAISIIEEPAPLERIVSITEDVAYQAESESIDSGAILKEYANTQG